MERAQRNLERLLEIQYQFEDIMENKQYKTYDLLSMLLDECADELEALIAEEVGDGPPIIEHIRNRIETIFGPKESEVSEVRLDQYIPEKLDIIKPQFSHRKVEITTSVEPVPSIFIPIDVLNKVVDGLLKNAIENTPDGGCSEITVKKKGEVPELMIRDFGVGITKENQERIFEGFFTTQETMSYSSKMPFDFNAGGKGADLLRTKIFAERYHFKINMESSRCGFIPKESDVCPGSISKCAFCTKKEDCLRSGGTTFTLLFTPAPDPPYGLD